MSNVPILSLFRRILRLHSRKLPDIQRAVGDQYVRQEFRAHLKVKPEQEREFLAQWEEYAAHLSLEADIFGIGRDLADSDIDAMTDEQKMQLQKLHKSAASIGVQTKTEDGMNPFEHGKR